MARELILKALGVLLAACLVVAAMPDLASAQGTALAVTPSSGPAGSEVTVVGSGWPLEYYGNGVQVGFYQNFGNGVLQRYADPIVLKPDANGGFSFKATVPASLKGGDIVTFSGLIGNGSGADANFTVTGGGSGGGPAPAVTVGKAYVANLSWAESAHFNPKDVVRYQIVISAAGAAVIHVQMRVVDPAGKVILDSGGDSPVSPDAGSVFFASTIPADAPTGTYMQTATVTYAGTTTTRVNGFSVGDAAPLEPPEWLTHLTDQDLVKCTVSMTALAGGIVGANGAELPVMVEATNALSDLGDYEEFFRILTSNPYWKGILLGSGNYVYSQFTACFMGVQGALQMTAGQAGRLVGQWLKTAISRRR